MAQNTLQDERVDLYSFNYDASHSHRGHRDRIAAHEQRIHSAIGPVNIKHRGGDSEPCICRICKRYRRDMKAGPQRYK